jgi:hypothetical protein
MIFSKKLTPKTPESGLQMAVESLRGHLNDQGTTQVGVAAAALSLESISDAQKHQLQTAHDSLGQALESLAAEMGMAGVLTEAQRDAATVAGLVSGDVRAFLKHPVSQPMVSTESMKVVTVSGIADSFSQRSLSVEAYDEKDNRNAAVYSIMYNMVAARQDEFGEAFFPTITVSPDNIGLAVSIRLFQVYDEFKRGITGALDKYNKKNIIRALIDPTILKNDQTRIIPVWRNESKDNFTDVALIPKRTIVHEGESIDTSPLLPGKKFSLLGLSQTDTLLASGVMDMTDSIDPAVVLSAVYVKVGADIIKFNTENLPLSTFAPAAQGLHRLMNLNFASSSLMINKDTKLVDGAALGALAAIADDDLIVRVEVNATGSVNVELGDTQVFGNSVSVAQVQNAVDEEILDLTAGAGKAIADLFIDAKIVGYDLRAYRTNLNRRQRGQFLDVTFFQQMYSVPLRAPITVIRPVTSDGQTDSSDLAGLITATHIRTSNAAVGAVIDASNQLNEYVDSRDTAGDGPDVLGVGRFLVRAAYERDTLDVATAIDSLTSSDRVEDLRSLLINRLRDMAYNLYVESGYKAAADAYFGGASKAPTVIIGTDPIIARYLIVEGDLRTLGPDFDVRIVHTLDNRVTGKIFLSFGQFDSDLNSKPNPLHFGCMGWKPEMTLTLPISRDGQISKELTVQPSFLHIVNMPIMGELTVQNISQVVASKVAINNHPV